MDCLNIDLNYPDHPKVIRLIALVGECADAYPIRLWSYVGRFHAKDGRLNGYSEREIEGLLRWHGEPGLLVNALESTTFLHRNANGFRVHDWKKHEGHIHAHRVRNRAAAISRWEKLKQLKGNLAMPVALPKPNPGMPSAQPSPAQPSPAQPSLINTRHRPTLEEVKAYCIERKNSVNPDRWFSHYQSNGWKVGKNPLRDWKAAVRTWESNDMGGGHGTRSNVGAALPVPGKYDGFES